MKSSQTIKSAKRISPMPEAMNGAEAWLPWLRKGLICCLLFVMPILIYLGNTEYGYTKSIFTLVVVSLLVIVWFAEMITRKNYSLHMTQLFWPGLGLIGAGTLSFVASQNLNVSFQSLNLLFYFGLLFLILANSIETESDAKLYLGCLLAAALPTGVYAILQYYGLQPGPSGYAPGRESVISFMGNRNYVAEYLAFLFAPTLIIFLNHRAHWLHKILLLFTILTLVSSAVALVVINSTAIWLGFIIGAFFSILAFGAIRLLQRLTARQRQWTLILTSIFVTLLLLVTSWGMVDIIKHPHDRDTWALKLLGPAWELWQANSGDIRSWDWWIGYEMWRASPWVGQGIGNFKIKFLQYKSHFAETERGRQFNFYIRPAAQAHNEFVQLSAEMGLVGIVALLSILGVLFGTTLTAAFRAPSNREKVIFLGLLAGVVVFLVDACFAFPLHLPASSLGLVFLLALLQSKWLRRDLAPVTLSPRAIAPWALLILLSIGAMAVSVIAVRDWLADTCLDRAQRYIKSKIVVGVAWERARELLEECSLVYDFQPSDVFFQLGALYEYRARVLSNSRDKTKNADEIKNSQMKSIRYFQKYLETKPNEYTYIQIALIYRRQGSQAREENRPEDAEVAFRLAEEQLRKLLAQHPSDILEREALFTIHVLIPLARTGSVSALPLVQQFLEKQPNYAKGYLTRGEIYLNFVTEGKSEYCQSSRQDLNTTIQLVNHEITEINIQAKEPRGPQVPIEVYAPLLIQAKETAEQDLKKLPC